MTNQQKQSVARNIYWPIAVIVLAAAWIWILSSGCAIMRSAMPLDRQWQIESDSYSAVLETMDDAYEAGTLTAEQLKTVEPYRIVAAQMLDEMQAAVLSGDTDKFQIAKRQLRIAIRGVAEVIQ